MFGEFVFIREVMWKPFFLPSAKEFPNPFYQILFFSVLGNSEFMFHPFSVKGEFYRCDLNSFSNLASGVSLTFAWSCALIRILLLHVLFMFAPLSTIASIVVLLTYTDTVNCRTIVSSVVFRIVTVPCRSHEHMSFEINPAWKGCRGIQLHSHPSLKQGQFCAFLIAIVGMFGHIPFFCFAKW